MSGMVFCAAVASADWADNFDGGLQQTWAFFDPYGGTGWTAGSVNDQLELTHPTTVGNGGSPVLFGVVPTEVFSDVRMSGWLNPNGSNDISDTLMLILRTDPNTQAFYGAEVSYDEQRLYLYRNNPSTSSKNLAFAEIPTLAYTDPVFLEVEAIGSSLKATAYDAPGGSVLGTTSVVDTELTAGLSGVLTVQRTEELPVLGVWDDVTAESIIVGDFSDNGVVDIADYTVWRNNLGAPAGTLPNDPDGSVIGLDQYHTWKDNFGAEAAGSFVAGAVAVPEPTTTGLLMVAALGLLSWRKR